MDLSAKLKIQVPEEKLLREAKLIAGANEALNRLSRLVDDYKLDRACVRPVVVKLQRLLQLLEVHDFTSAESLLDELQEELTTIMPSANLH